MLKRLWKNTKGYRVPMFLTPVFVVIEVLMEVVIPFLMTVIIDVGINPSQVSPTDREQWIVDIISKMFYGGGEINNEAFIMIVGGIMVFCAAVSLLFGSFSAVTAAKATMGFAKNLRRDLFECVQNFSFYNVDKYSTASLVTRMTIDVNNIQMAFMLIIRVAVRAPFMLIMSTIMAFAINSELATIFLFAIPVIGIGFALIASKAFPRFKKMLVKYDDMNASVQENLVGVREVKTYNREDFEKGKFYESSEDVRTAELSAEKLIALNTPLMQFVMYTCSLLLIILGSMIISGDGSMLSGELFSLFTYSSQILMSINMVTMVAVMLVMSGASLKRVSEVIEEVPDIKSGEEKVVENGEVIFDNVTFGYSNDNPILTDLNFTIRSGETVGIISGTGQGKSSLVQLIPRFYDVKGGAVKVGGKDVRDYDLVALRDNVSMVLQKNVLFSGTIRDNMKWGDENASDEQICHALDVAGALDFVESFPRKLDTELGQGGVNVSGGQKQRLCIARALLKRPKIIILDDSTSAVDTATDAKIRNNLRTELHGTTTIIIAQRITSVMDADKIIVINENRIQDIGTHDELLECNEIYREVYNSQIKGGKL